VIAMKKFKLIIILMLLSSIFIFVFQNYQVVEIRFLFWHLDMSRSMLVFLLFCSGTLAGWILRGLK